MATPAFITALLPSRPLLRDWFIKRIDKRRGPTTLPFQFEYRHIYILPTAFGFGFGLMLIFMALGGLNFNNNMALLIVFLLASVAQLTTLLAYRNLVGLTLNSIRAEPVFCGESALFHVHIDNPHDRRRFSLQSGTDSITDCVDIGPSTHGRLGIRTIAENRGWLEMPPFKLETRFPIGLFRAWSWYIPRSRCLVYPEPARNPPPLPRTGAGQSGIARKGEGDQVHSLRKYRPGDSLRRIAWRASARHDELFTLEMESPRDEACELAWSAVPGKDVETRLSILTAWVLNAEHKQIPYSLELPDHSVPPGLGLEHRAEVLEHLALFGR